MGELINTGTGLARAGVAGDEPAATELVAFPFQTAETRDAAFRIARNEQEPNGDEGQKNSASREKVLWMPKRNHDV
jgi:hypothetical protein